MTSPVPKKIKEIADQIEKLSITVGNLKKFAENEDDAVAMQNLSDNLFSIQSKMRYEYYFLAQGLWED